MENENNEEIIIDSTENNEEIEIDLQEEVEETPEVVEEQPEVRQEETLEARRARLARQLEQTEKKLGIVKPKPVHNNTGKDISMRDVLALSVAGITDDGDIDEVQEIAQIKKISISEALKLNLTKNILAQKKEERTVSAATNTGTARRGTSKVSDEVLLERARRGELPQSDEDIARLYSIRRR